MFLHEICRTFLGWANDGAVFSDAAALGLPHEAGRVLGQAGIQGLGRDSFPVPNARFSKAGASLERWAAIDPPFPELSRRVRLRLLALLETAPRFPASAGFPQLRGRDNPLALPRFGGQVLGDCVS